MIPTPSQIRRLRQTAASLRRSGHTHAADRYDQEADELDHRRQRLKMTPAELSAEQYIQTATEAELRGDHREAYLRRCHAIGHLEKGHPDWEAADRYDRSVRIGRPLPLPQVPWPPPHR